MNTTLLQEENVRLKLIIANQSLRISHLESKRQPSKVSAKPKKDLPVQFVPAAQASKNPKKTASARNGVRIRKHQSY